MCHSLRIEALCGWLVLGVVWSGSGSFASAQATEARPTALAVGEELVYNVRYSFFDLGQIKIQTVKDTRTREYHAYNGRADIASYASVPFVHVRAVFESVIDSAGFSRWFMGKSQEEENRWDFARYDFDYGSGRVLMEVGMNDSMIARRDTLAVTTPCQDGLSLFFFAREHLFSNHKYTVPTIIKEQNVNTYIDFKNEHETAEIDAVDYPIDVVRFEGTADFVGFYGLTGDFEGWFSNDNARIPITAKLKVIIGSVTVELVSWKRAGWTPPRSKG
jgi:hypothetical protein